MPSGGSGRLIAVSLGVAPRAHQDKKIRLGSRHRIALHARRQVVLLLAGAEQIPSLRQRCDQGDRAARNRNPARRATCAHSVDGPETPACAVPSAVIAPAALIDSTQVGEQCLRSLDRARVGRFEPAECFHVVDAARLEREDRLRQDPAVSLRKVPGRARSLCSCAVQSRKQCPGAVRPARPAR